MSSTKKLIFIIIIVCFLVAIGVGVYFGLKKIPNATQPTGSFPITTSNSETEARETTPVVTGSIVGESVSEEGINASRASIITKGPASVVWMTDVTILQEQIASSSLLQSAVFYMNTAGEVVRVHDISKESVVSQSGLPNPLQVVQNNNGSFVVVKFGSGAYMLFDVIKQVWTFLPRETVSATFSPDGKKLAYLVTESTGKQSLYTQNLITTKKELTKIFSLAIDDVSLVWPIGTKIYMVPPPSARVVQSVWYFDMNTKTVGTFVSGNGVSVIFSPTTTQALIFRNTDSKTIRMYLRDTKTGTEKSLETSTLGNKCTFIESDDIVCGVPYELSKTNGYQLPDDYLSMFVFTADRLFLLKKSEGYLQEIVFESPTTRFDVKGMRAHRQQIVFINRLDDSLYAFDMRGL